MFSTKILWVKNRKKAYKLICLPKRCNLTLEWRNLLVFLDFSRTKQFTLKYVNNIWRADKEASRLGTTDMLNILRMRGFYKSKINFALWVSFCIGVEESLCPNKLTLSSALEVGSARQTQVAAGFNGWGIGGDHSF